MTTILLPPHFGYDSTTMVLGCPSKGGIYVYYTYCPIDLDFLHLDRFNPVSRSPNTVEEDVHCVNMRKLGARWWESEEAWDRYAIFHQQSPDDPFIVVGWLSGGGVWVLKTTRQEALKLGAGKAGNAYNMDERCQIIEKLGGTFYKEPEKCPHLDLA
jgi:hypothetical protein